MGLCNNGLLVNGSNAVLDLNGHSATIGAVGLIDGSIVNNSTTTAILTGSSYVVLNGTISVPLGDSAASLIKSTSGTVTLGGDNDYTGLTSVRGGVLNFVGWDAWNPILNGGGVDVQDGKIIFNYNGGATPAATVKSQLTYSYDGGVWNRGQIRVSIATSRRKFGMGR